LRPSANVGTGMHADDAAASLHDIPVKDIDGNATTLAPWRGQVMLIVNTASKCGNTPQYAALETLYAKHKDDGFVVLGFPCNQFGGQEPGTATEISQFCKENYGVEFDLMAKVDVNGPTAVPLYKFLTSEKTNPKHAGKISWNFEKFLFDRDGQLVTRFKPRTAPDAPEVVAAVEAELAKK